MKLVITGVPGTGKTVIASKLAKEMEIPLIDLSRIAVENELYRKNKDGEKEVKLRELKKKILKIIRNKSAYLIEGHLACEFNIPCERIVVLRCNPNVLEKRLKRRKYSGEKIYENIASEILDYCLIRTMENYPEIKVMQIDTSKKSLRKTVKAVKERENDKVNWMVFLSNPKLERKIRLVG